MNNKLLKSFWLFNALCSTIITVLTIKNGGDIIPWSFSTMACWSVVFILNFNVLDKEDKK